jgi:uncharacterized protein YndB with AHSA1/START domain
METIKIKSMETINVKEAVIVQQMLKAPVQKIWKALTEPAQLKKWFFHIPVFKAIPGFQFEFSGQEEFTQHGHKCRIVEAVADHKLTFTWRYKKLQGVSKVTFEFMQEQKNLSIVRLIHDGLHHFTQESGLTIDMFEQGWNQVIRKNLREHLEHSLAPAH